jgi:hypothetical protein
VGDENERTQSGDASANEDLLWEASPLGSNMNSQQLSDQLLIAYREQRLDQAEAGRVEAILIGNVFMRRRLEQLAAIEFPAPQSVRERLFGDRAPTRPGGQTASWWRLVAAAAVLIVVPLVTWQIVVRNAPGPTGTAIATVLPSYAMSVEGLAFSRSSASGSTVTALTEVSVSISPEISTSTPVEIGLYRLDGSTLQRVATSLMSEAVVERGAARFRLEAQLLVGPELGTRSFFAAVSTKSPLTEALEVNPDTNVRQTLESAIAGHVLEQTLTVIGGRPSGSSPEE